MSSRTESKRGTGSVASNISGGGDLWRSLLGNDGIDAQLLKDFSSASSEITAYNSYTGVAGALSSGGDFAAPGPDEYQGLLGSIRKYKTDRDATKLTNEEYIKLRKEKPGREATILSGKTEADISSILGIPTSGVTSILGG